VRRPLRRRGDRGSGWRSRRSLLFNESDPLDTCDVDEQVAQRLAEQRKILGTEGINNLL
jgi:hypothetical protein